MAGGAVKSLTNRVIRRVPHHWRRRAVAMLPRQALLWLRGARTDVYMVSFPKCGRTWLRVMVGRAMQLHYGLEEGRGIVELHRLAEQKAGVPCIYASHDDFWFQARPEDLDDDKMRYRGSRVVLLVRDPRDVIVSFYHHRSARDFSGSIDDFIDQREGGFRSLLAFYDNWAANLETPAECLVVRYEDLHASTGDELRRVLDFIGIAVSDDVLDEAVGYGSFDNMRRLEERNALGTEKLKPRKPGDYRTYKTRRGTVGGHRDELTAGQIGRLDELMRDSQVHRFGYGTEPVADRNTPSDSGTVETPSSPRIAAPTPSGP